MLRVLLILAPLALAIYALVDLVQTPEDDVQGLPKLAWVVLVVLIWVVGPIAWLVAGKRGGRRWLPGLTPRPAGPAGGGRRPVAPDDDPDFLRGLGRTPPQGPPTPPTPPPMPPTRPTDGTGEGPDDGPDDPPLAAR